VLRVSDSDFEFNTELLQGYPLSQGRRRKAALLLILVWSSVAALHVSIIGTWIVVGITLLMGVRSLQLLGTCPSDVPEPIALDMPAESYPFVSLAVAAKDEEAVIVSLVERLCALNYPAHRYELWIVDDNSSDRTPILLAELAQKFPMLRWLRRGAGATGGKSGALNQVLPLMKGEVIGVFDADAQVPPDLLRAVLPYFAQPQVGAVQVRKAIANAPVNFWTQGQSVEMIFDAFLHERRYSAGGLGELRGNGQFVRRTALDACGSWNEDTITDDLDLTFRLHLSHWDIASVMLPVVQEEGVTRPIGLWHQRNRWAEGGYQRHLDYWPLLLGSRLGHRKRLDLAMFSLLQYGLPMGLIPDTLLSAWRHHLPVLMPLSGLTMGLSCVSMFAGINRIRRQQSLPPQRLSALFQALLGTVYMFHWFVVVASVTARMSVRPKRFNWVKTVHVGQPHAPTSS
jgi:1,2-diacylglycerol 3-beta-glucosyltransferase